jgi:hypothetical protein
MEADGNEVCPAFDLQVKFRCHRRIPPTDDPNFTTRESLADAWLSIVS